MNSVLDDVKSVVQIVFYSVASVASLVAILTYRQNQSLERARWAAQLYEKFYEEFAHKGVRRELDCSADSDRVLELVSKESPEFTDYLNFFEHVAYLAKCGQIKQADVEAYFGYYLACLKRHPAVIGYISNVDNGFEELAELLRT